MDWEKENRVGVVVHGIASENGDGDASWNGRRGTAATGDVLRALSCAHQPRLGDGGAEVPDGSLDFIEQRIDVKFAPFDADRGTILRRGDVVEQIKWANLALRPARARVESRESDEGELEWQLTWRDEGGFIMYYVILPLTFRANPTHNLTRSP